MSPSILDPIHGGYVSAEQLINSSSTRNSAVFSDVSETSSISSVNDSDIDNDQLPSPLQILKSAPRPTSCFKQPALPGTAVNSLHENLLAGKQYQQQQIHPRRCLSGSQHPPKLARSDERKSHFVSDLVDSATSMVEVIWPKWDAARCSRPSGRVALTMRRYIEETLRRSRTSYSTLQVALYYLILIKYNMPAATECSNTALHCGRRMFLAALILASKYLQDRNYSAKAWSKMSGLTPAEINSNERSFLSVVNWKLHIPDRIFKRWTDVVLRFTTPQPQSLICRGSSVDGQMLWRQVIPFLTPELDDPQLPLNSIEDGGCPTPESGSSSPLNFGTSIMLDKSDYASLAPPSSRFRASRLDATPASSPGSPALKRMGPLPTPSMTPSTVAAGTPAVGACHRFGPSLSALSSQDHQANYRASAMACLSRCGSLAPSVFSLGSSPESMITDTSSLSSSMCSTSGSIRAPCWPSAAQPAIDLSTEHSNAPRRSARFQGTASKPISIDEAPMSKTLVDLTMASFGKVTAAGCKRACPIDLDQADTGNGEIIILDEDSSFLPAQQLTAANIENGRKRHCPSRPSPPPPPSSSSSSSSSYEAGGISITTPPKSSSPELLMQVAPGTWSILVE